MNVAKLKIAELKKALKERSLPTGGNKSELAARLREALAAEGGGDAAAQQEEDLEAKESELLGEEEEEEEDATSAEELDTKLLETSTTTQPATPAARPKKIVINREAAETAQQAAATAIAEAAKAPPAAAAAAAPAAAPSPATGGDAAPAAKRIKLTGLTESERLAKRAEKLGGVPTSDKLSNLKILTPEERKAARLAKFGSPAAPAGNTAAVKNGADDVEKLKRRAERFGEAVSAKVVSMEESERMKKRKERFGIVTPEDAKARRAARFSSSTPIDPATEDKKKLRAARFGLA